MIITLCNALSRFLWAFPMPVLLLGTHIYFTFRLGFIQRLLPRGIRLSFTKKNTDAGHHCGVSPYGALATALAATIGTGNIIGISTAIAIGGPGAVFWCWLTGVLGIATCYSECLLSLLHRTKISDTSYLGGPMYVLKNGLHKKGLALLFSIAAILASFGMGSSVQSHSIYTALHSQFSLSPHLAGMAAAILAGFVILGGIQGISRICTFFVPIMSLFYLSGCFWLLFLNRGHLSEAFFLILNSAFSSRSVAGGLTGTGVMLAIRTGLSRGLFTNEAGLGSIPMAAATAQTKAPVAQSLISMTGPFWDTVVICAITGLVIVSSMLKSPADFQKLPPDRLCFAAFSLLPFFGEEILSLSLIFFAFATILGWCWYGECAVRFLSGEKGLNPYRLLYLMSIYLGSVVSLELIWGLSDLLNALMTLPNILCLWLLRKDIFRATAGAKLK